MKISLVFLLLTSVNQFSRGLADYTCKCGWRNYQNRKPWRIFLGEEATRNEFPMMAALLFGGQQQCGASIITERHALTAAHCTFNLSLEYLTLRIGVHNLHDAFPRDVNLDMVYYNDYNCMTIQNDIALLVTQTIIPFTRIVGPVCLPNRRLDLDGQTGTILGWGQTEFGVSSPVLKKIDVNIISYTNCLGRINLPDGGNVFCIISNLWSHVCKGDSGGPVLWNDPDTGMETIVALASYVLEGVCPLYTFPAVYTDVTAHLDWINEKVEESVPGLRPCIKVA